MLIHLVLFFLFLEIESLLLGLFPQLCFLLHIDKMTLLTLILLILLMAFFLFLAYVLDMFLFLLLLTRYNLLFLLLTCIFQIVLNLSYMIEVCLLTLFSHSPKNQKISLIALPFFPPSTIYFIVSYQLFT